MRALERYQSYAQTWRDPKYDNDTANIDLVRNMLSVADAAIAELEAQVASLIADWNKEHPKRLDAEAELAALKGMLRHHFEETGDHSHVRGADGWISDLRNRWAERRTG